MSWLLSTRHHMLWWILSRKDRSCAVPGAPTRTDRVVDSRAAEAGVAIRRRRECLHCHRRFTTYERARGDRASWWSSATAARSRSTGRRSSSGVAKAIKNRPVTDEQVERLAAKVEEKLRRKGPVVTTQEVGLEVLALLREAGRRGLPAVRERLQGLPGGHRLRARAGPAAPEAGAGARARQVAARARPATLTRAVPPSVPFGTTTCCGLPTAKCLVDLAQHLERIELDTVGRPSV